MTKRKGLFLVLLGVFLLLLPWIFFDIDLGDQSYDNIAGWIMAFHPKQFDGSLPYWFEVVPVWGSLLPDFVFWKAAGPEASFLILRFCWVLWHMVMASCVFLFFSRFESSKKVLAAVLLTVVACVAGADHFTLTYNTVPVGMGLLSLLCFAMSLEAKTSRAQLFSLVAAGFFSILSCAARLPVVVFWSMFWLFALVLFKFHKEKKAGLGQSILSVMSGVLLGAGFVVLALWASGQAEFVVPGLRGFVHSIVYKEHARYGGASFVPKALGHYLKFFQGYLLFVFVRGICSYFRKSSRYVCLALVTIAFALIAREKYGVLLSLIIGGGLGQMIEVVWRRRREWRLIHWALFFSSGFLVVIFPFGTFLDGVQNYKYGLWLLLPSVLLIWKDERESSRWKSDHVGRVIIGLAAMVLFISTRLYWPTFPYQEQPIYRMMASFHSPALSGLHTYPEKAQAIDDLLNVLKDRGLKPGDDLLAYSGVGPWYPISFVYLATHTRPVLNDPGIIEYPGGRWKRQKELLRKMGEKGQLPRWVVRQKRLFAFPDRPKEAFSWTTPEDNWLAGQMDQLLKAAGYRLSWENDYFAVLVKR